MWQSLVRNWLLSTAKERLYEAAREQAGRGAQPDAQPADPPGEPLVCHVGLVFALGIEADGFAGRLSGTISREGAGFVAREGALAGRRMVIVESGAGCEAAARGTRALLTGHQPRLVISAGFAGGLNEHVRRGDIVLADAVLDRAGRRLAIDVRLDPKAVAAMPGLHVGPLVTVDEIVHTPADKQALGRELGALAVDMETFAVAEACREQRTPFLSVRVITDAMNDELPADLDRLVRKKTTAGRLGAAAGNVLRRPGSIKEMWQLKEDAIVASGRLGKFLAGLVEQWG